MEQNLVSDEELIERINKVLSETKGQKSSSVADIRQDSSCEKFHDVYESTEEEITVSEKKTQGEKKNLVLENHYLALQLQAEKKKSKDLQSKYKLFENSIKYFERLNGQLETIKKAVDEENPDTEKVFIKYDTEAMQKIRPKTIHTAPSGGMSNAGAETVASETANFSEPHSGETKKAVPSAKNDQEEVAFREADDFKQLEQGLEIVKDKVAESDAENEKVFITKTEKKCLEDIGNLAARTRAPLDDKHQRYFEKDRRKFANSITMPDIQEVEKGEPVPPEIMSKTKETPVNITSTELDGLRSYLLQLKELIARRETAWARTTERDYNQRVEITRFKNEVSHLRMLCDKRQKEIKERDQIIMTKDEEIRELQKRVQVLKNAIAKLEKREEKLLDAEATLHDGPDASHIIQRSYNAMKRQSAGARSHLAGSSLNLTSAKQPVNVSVIKPLSPGKDFIPKVKPGGDRAWKKVKASGSTSNDEEKLFVEKSKAKGPRENRKPRHKSESVVHKPKDRYDKVDEKLQRVEEMLHNEVLRGARKVMSHSKPRNQTDFKTLLKNTIKTPDYPSPAMKKLTPSNSTIRQEMLTVMTGLNSGSVKGGTNYPSNKKNPTASIIANALLAARNVNLFNL